MKNVSRRSFITSAAALATFTAFSATGCGSSEQKAEDGAQSAAQESTGTVDAAVVAAMPSAWSDLYPMGEVSYYDNIIFYQVYDALVKQNPDGSYEGELAESWTVNDASDEITFKLHSGVKWHDGVEFTAKDVESTIKMYGNADIKSSSRYYLRYLGGCDASGVEKSTGSIEVEATDDTTIVIKLKKPTFVDTVLDDLTHVYILADHIISDLSAKEINKAATWAEPVGTGAFKYSDVVDGERMEFTANEDYFRGAPKFSNLVIRVVESANLLSGLMNGEIDTVLYGGIPLDDWAMAKEQSNLTCQSSPATGYQVLSVNTSKKYLTQEIRQAISMAIDRNTLVNQLLQGEGEAIVTPICSISPYYDSSVEVWFDQEKAKQIVQDAGFNQTLEFYVPTGNTIREKAATLIAENLKAVGIETNINSVDFSTAMSALQKGDYDLGIIGSGGTLNPTESSEMLSGSFDLCQLPEDNELIELLTKADSLLTVDERKTVLNEFQAKTKEISAYVYLFTTYNLVAYTNRLSNVNVDDFGIFNWNTYTWTVTE